MDGLEKWIKRNKKLCVLTGIFGLLVSPFLWPIFVAIIFQSLSLAMPFIVAWLLMKKPWKEKEEEDEELCKKGQHGKNPDAGKMPSDGAQADDIPESRTEKGQEPVSSRKKESAVPDEESCLAILWYRNEGRERIRRIRERADKEGRREFSISKDGICTVRRDNGFQRVGVLRGYPGEQILSAADELKKDGFSIKAVGNYIWISWKKGGMQHAL